MYVISLNIQFIAKKDIWWCLVFGGSKWYSCLVVSFQRICFPYVILTNYLCYSHAWHYTKKLHQTFNFWIYCHNALFHPRYSETAPKLKLHSCLKRFYKSKLNKIHKIIFLCPRESTQIISYPTSYNFTPEDKSFLKTKLGFTSCPPWNEKSVKYGYIMS